MTLDKTSPVVLLQDILIKKVIKTNKNIYKKLFAR